MEQMIEFMKLAKGDLMMKTDGYGVALVGHGWIQAQTDESWGKYFNHEFKLLKDQILRKGYASIFIIHDRASSVAHFRVTYSLGEFQVHRLD